MVGISVRAWQEGVRQVPPNFGPSKCKFQEVNEARVAVLGLILLKHLL